MQETEIFDSDNHVKYQTARL